MRITRPSFQRVDDDDPEDGARRESLLRVHEIAALLGRPVADLFGPPDATVASRALHESTNGDRWALNLAPDGGPVVRHTGDAASGGHVTDLAVGAFLERDRGSPQHEALLREIERLIASSLAG